VSCELNGGATADLAAGTLSGADRAAALAHVAECPSCQEELAAMARAVDGLLLLAPPVEPPVGFESRVLERTAGDEAAPGRGRLVAMAVLVAVLLIGLVVQMAKEDPSTPPGQRPPLVAVLTARDGRDVGRAVLAPGWLVVDVAGLGAGDEAYRVEVEQGGGRARQAGTVRLIEGRGTAKVRLSGGPVEGVRLLSAAGDYECHARFTSPASN
jgi:hypothetical protein